MQVGSDGDPQAPRCGVAQDLSPMRCHVRVRCIRKDMIHARAQAALNEPQAVCAAVSLGGHGKIYWERLP